jgi:hypothetical protein
MKAQQHLRVPVLGASVVISSVRRRELEVATTVRICRNPSSGLTFHPARLPPIATWADPVAADD